ncbi:MAG: DUF4935 domain-containing protein [Candidatus Marinimicrobia bacterium]|nr:DUF4935 domain-containing protein [Candidatus Neomarinimicrobiota bacterium]
MELTGRHLFIDTCIYDAKNYSFDINILDHISRLAQKKSIHLVSSEIVRQEVLSHVKNKCQTTLSALKKFHREAKILRNIEAEPYVSYFNVFNSDSACKDIERKMDDFFNITDTLFVDVNDVNPKSIIDDYFKSTPPFSEGNKKAEFPDAFILHSLSTWSQKTGNVVSVVSTDKDMKHFCEKSTILQYCEDLLYPVRATQSK